MQYNDLSLGLVTGTARVSPDERSVQVVMVHPADKREYRLQSKSIERMRDGLRIVLSGASPPAKRRIYHEIAQPIDLTAGMSELQASLGNTKLRVPIIKPSAPDTDEVTIDLEWAGRDTLSGIWSFRALADTGRDARMGGRTGALALNSDGSGLATVSHSEIWFRPRTYIERVFVIQDQTSVYEGKAAWAYPLDEQGRQTGTALIDRTRTLLVLGRNLPSEHTDLPELASPDPLIDYRVRAAAVDLKTGQYDAELQRVWDRLAGESVPQAQIDRLRAMEMMLVTAHVEDRGLQPDKRILPGLKALSIDGALGEWLLEYGDFVAALRVVRPLLKAGTFEPITHAFRPERIQFEIEAVRELPYDEIPLLVAVNGHIRTFDGESKFGAIAGYLP